MAADTQTATKPPDPPPPPPPPAESRNQDRADRNSLRPTPEFQKGLDDFSARKEAGQASGELANPGSRPTDKGAEPTQDFQKGVDDFRARKQEGQVADTATAQPTQSDQARTQADQGQEGRLQPDHGRPGQGQAEHGQPERTRPEAPEPSSQPEPAPSGPDRARPSDPTDRDVPAAATSEPESRGRADIAEPTGGSERPQAVDGSDSRDDGSGRPEPDAPGPTGDGTGSDGRQTPDPEGGRTGSDDQPESVRTDGADRVDGSDPEPDVETVEPDAADRLDVTDDAAEEEPVEPGDPVGPDPSRYDDTQHLADDDRPGAPRAVDTSPETERLRDMGHDRIDDLENLGLRIGGDPRATIDDYHPQGEDPRYQGTCGIASVEGVLRQKGQDVGEYDLVHEAADQGLCTTGSSADHNGGTTMYDRADLLSAHGVPNRIETDRSIHDLADHVEQGDGVIAAVNTGEFRDDPNPEVWQRGSDGRLSTNHAVHVVGTVRTGDGDLLGFLVNDSSGHPAYFADRDRMSNAWEQTGGRLNVTVDPSRD